MKRRAGFTLIEVVLAIALGALIVSSIGAVMSQVGNTRRVAAERLELTYEAQFALQKMVDTVRDTRLLLIPSRDKHDTSWREHVREETVPASPPEPGSTRATAVLAATLSAAFDLDGDGVADADNDGDGLLDEDLPADISNDSDPGVHQFDDGGNGLVDESFFSDADDDERLSVRDEDPINGIDDDGDGNVDEDPSADMNGDGAPGIAGVDDDGDGSIDEGDVNDDDEDGSVDEDWLDAVVFYLNGSDLEYRHPVPWDESGTGGIDGRDFLISTLASDVTALRFERIPASTGDDLVAISLTLTRPSGAAVTLDTQVRVGSSL